MAKLKGFEKGGESMKVTLHVTQTEYELLKKSEDDLLLLPADPQMFSIELTAGKLGNGNRIMLPNRLLEAHNIPILNKKLPSNILEINGVTYLLLKLKEKKPGIPTFRE